MQTTSASRSRTKTKREPLNRDKIARAALAFIDSEGIEEFSTRRLGKELGVEGMALYKHFDSREELLDAVTELMISEITLPAKGGGWQDRVRDFARQYRALARTHPRAYPLLAMRRLGSEKSLALVNEIFAALLEEGFSAPDAAMLFRLVGNFCNGTALDELAITAHLSSGKKRDLPHQEVDAFLHPAYFDAHFEAGLDFILDGFARRRPGKGKE